jgi:hypothetical protein
VCAELLHHAVALLLRDAAVQRLGVVAAAVQRLGELVDLGARAAEDDRARRLLDVEDAAERRHLVRARHDVGDLAHLRPLARGDHLGASILITCTGSRRCAWRSRRCAAEGGREERRLLLLRRRGEDRLEVLGEAHVEHLVGLVEHDQLDVRGAASCGGCGRARAPGVATTTSTPRLSARIWLHRLRRRRSARRRAESLAVAWIASATCIASSRVGTSTSAAVRSRGGAPGESVEERQREGGRLAGAGGGLPSTSRPASTAGSLALWIGVGSS